MCQSPEAVVLLHGSVNLCHTMYGLEVPRARNVMSVHSRTLRRPLSQEGHLVSRSLQVPCRGSRSSVRHRPRARVGHNRSLLRNRLRSDPSDDRPRAALTCQQLLYLRLPKPRHSSTRRTNAGAGRGPMSTFSPVHLHQVLVVKGNGSLSRHRLRHRRVCCHRSRLFETLQQAPICHSCWSRSLSPRRHTFS